MTTRTCVECGEPVRHGTGLEAVTAWQGPDPDSPLELVETIAVIHAECYLVLAPAARSELAAAIARGDR